VTSARAGLSASTLSIRATKSPGAAVAEHDDVVAGDNKLAARQLQDQRLIEGRHRREVEGVQALHRREAGLADAPLNQAALAVDQFKLR